MSLTSALLLASPHNTHSGVHSVSHPVIHYDFLSFLFDRARGRPILGFFLSVSLSLFHYLLTYLLTYLHAYYLTNSLHVPRLQLSSALQCSPRSLVLSLSLSALSLSLSLSLSPLQIWFLYISHRPSVVLLFTSHVSYSRFPVFVFRFLCRLQAVALYFYYLVYSCIYLHCFLQLFPICMYAYVCTYWWNEK